MSFFYIYLCPEDANTVESSAYLVNQAKDPNKRNQPFLFYQNYTPDIIWTIEAQYIEEWPFWLKIILHYKLNKLLKINKEDFLFC